MKKQLNLEINNSYFINRALEITRSKKESSTHFAILSKDGQIKYAICLKKHKKVTPKRLLLNNISSYSKKLSLLLFAIRFLPLSLLEKLRVGFYASITPKKEISLTIDSLTKKILLSDDCLFNLIVGTYNYRQKIVFQLFSNSFTGCYYLKVGDSSSFKEMLNEINYLAKPIAGKLFENPTLLYSKLPSLNNDFTYQLTKEILGKGIRPRFDKKIYDIFLEISSSKSKNGLYFSHGDFTPWNIRISKKRVIVFDWEYCGYRFYGFDLIHFLWQVENKLNKKDENKAIKDAVKKAKKIDPQLRNANDSALIEQYFDTLKKQFGDCL